MSYIDEKIIEMRCNRAYIKTIHNWVVSQSTLLDEIVCLSRVITTLDGRNLPYSRKEVRTAFNKYHNKEFHGNAQTYLNWLCVNCSKKVVFPSKLKSSMKSKGQGKIKTPVAVTLEHDKHIRTHKLELKSQSKGSGHSVENRGVLYGN